jgi:hypothetical protein
MSIGKGSLDMDGNKKTIGFEPSNWPNRAYRTTSASSVVAVTDEDGGGGKCDGDNNWW